jgi:hypothetical protein
VQPWISGILTLEEADTTDSAVEDAVVGIVINLTILAVPPDEVAVAAAVEIDSVEANKANKIQKRPSSAKWPLLSVGLVNSRTLKSLLSQNFVLWNPLQLPMSMI